MYGLDSSIHEIIPSLFVFSPTQHTVWSLALKTSKEKLELKMKWPNYQEPIITTILLDVELVEEYSLIKN